LNGPDVQHFHDADTGTLSYVVSDPASGAAAVIDPLLGFSMSSGRIDDRQARDIIAWLRDHQLRLHWILETHAHADHLSAAQYIKSELGGSTGIGEGICAVQERFAHIFNYKPPFRADGHQFDRLFADGEAFALGELTVRVIATPGHTSDSITYLVGDAAFPGDSIFMPDYGTARCDFPGGDAGQLYDSIQALLALPPDTRLFMCHDYRPNERELRFEATVREQADTNIHVRRGTRREDFVRMREQRDATLDLPRLLLPAIQVNIRAGNLPPAEDNQVAYLKIPLDYL